MFKSSFIFALLFICSTNAQLWETFSWSQIGSTSSADFPYSAYALALFPPNIYVAGSGNIYTYGNTPTWTRYQSITSGGTIYTILPISQAEIYLGGSFTGYFAKFDGNGRGTVGNYSIDGTIQEMVRYGTGSDFLVGGNFYSPYRGFMKFDAVLQNFTQIRSANGSVPSFQSVNTISVNGTEIWVGASNGLWKYDGVNWSTNYLPSTTITAIALNQTHVFVCGSMSSRIMSLETSNNSFVQVPGAGDFSYYSTKMVIFGNSLIVSGSLASGLYWSRFDGSAWLPLNNPPNGYSNAMAKYGNVLYVAGSFYSPFYSVGSYEGQSGGAPNTNNSAAVNLNAFVALIVALLAALISMMA